MSRIRDLPESAIEGTHYTKDDMLRRLAASRATYVAPIMEGVGALPAQVTLVMEAHQKQAAGGACCRLHECVLADSLADGKASRRGGLGVAHP